MPELPEVQTVVDTLRPALVGSRGRRGKRVNIVRVVHLRSDIVTPAECDLARMLAGRRVDAIDRRGKRITFLLDDGNHLFIHLGMTGRLTVEPAAAPLRKHTHLIAALSDGRQLRFADARRFGGIVWLGGGCCDEGIGPEPLTMRASQLFKQLQRTRRVIKTALLDQKLVAGIGNIYADEALFASKIHPLTVANKITAAQARRLNKAIKRVLLRAIEHRGSTLRDYVDARGKRGKFQRLHQIYDREGKPCVECGTPIQRIVVGGRSTCFCRKCQNKSHR
jgi:formamidopyrimidine-DNA glycosylase